ncbi:MAG TPA: sulfurtransferase TusA family protein [Pedococcus sp.]|nr:sulfurtransferase TusA family protein [Pedococcus sp.]
MTPRARPPAPLAAADSFATPADVVVDARGLRCPLPVIRLAARAKEALEGTVLEVLATDPAARADIPAWCRLREQAYLGSLEQRDGTLAHPGEHTAYRVRIMRAGPRTSAAPTGPPPPGDAGTPVEG